ncbi:MAG: 16S rRNA (uracil(1498)-N(3))-methyltransferase [Alphaproteobacteria bacterium]|nr:16S rRNA (uracil(1498)-N(3))-methyltransferase [Alphaproteobacteria bacterium]
MKQAFKKIRLYVPEPLSTLGFIEIAEQQAHYLSQVMRCEVGDGIHLFNGVDGEWLADITEIRKKALRLQLRQQVRAQVASPDVWLVFAPIKMKTEAVVEKATELGASNIICTFMKHSVVVRINHDKLTAHAVEAAEQCERLDVPIIQEAQNLGRLLAEWPEDRLLLYGDESGHGKPLAEMAAKLPYERGEYKKYAILIGPEGGFSRDEHHMLQVYARARGFGMGPRILRADTAAVAALACVMSQVGDWNEKPHFIAKSSEDLAITAQGAARSGEVWGKESQSHEVREE